jgi:hypothetical protein
MALHELRHYEVALHWTGGRHFTDILTYFDSQKSTSFNGSRGHKAWKVMPEMKMTAFRD